MGRLARRIPSAFPARARSGARWRAITPAWGAVIACALLSLGCASKPGDLRPSDEEARFRRESRTALDSDELSETTQVFLRRNLLDSKDLPALHARLLDRHEREVAFHLAEIAFAEGKASRDPDHAAKCHLSAAAYAYAFLFDDALGPRASPFDPRFRWSSDLYNRAMDHVVARAAERRPGRAGAFRLPALLWEVGFERGRTETVWDPEVYERVLAASGFEVTGLGDSARERGLGVPVICVRSPPVATGAAASDRFLPPVRLTHASTVLVRFGELPRPGGVQEATIDVLDPVGTRTVRIGDVDVPLDADFTTPVAYLLKQAPEYSGFDAMRHSGEYEQFAQLIMLQPYDPGRIPVVFVHGLMSAPMTWAPLLNGLVADPVLRARCQFWFFRYPTGFPILYSASLLRAALTSAAATFDPLGRNPAFQDMVICSHSMGGLLSKIQVQTSGDRLWAVISETPIDRLDIPERDREVLRRGFEFERLPFVTRVIFMATPHRGSDLATGLVGYLGASMISEPEKITAVEEEVRPVLRAVYRDRGAGAIERAITGIGNLDPENPVQREIATWPFPPGVTIHSIIGNEHAAEPGGSDGVVAYGSSHLDGVASERVVRSGHGVHQTTAGIEEVRRILRLHVAHFDASSEPAR